MLRAILWKLGAEWANLVRLVRPRHQDRVYYFTFGANLDDSVLLRRKIRVFDSFDHVLDGAALRFTQPGFYHQHGYASADPAEDEKVYGKVYQILATDARRMDYFEGEPFLRVHEKVTTHHGEIEYYYYRTTRIVDGLKPTREYLDYLLNAYETMDTVPQEYIEKMGTTEVLQRFEPTRNPSVFVRNLPAWPEWLHPTLIVYERWLQRFVEFTWHKSLIQWAIRL